MWPGPELYVGQFSLDGSSGNGAAGIGKLRRSHLVFHGYEYANVDADLVYGIGFGHFMGGLPTAQALR